MIACVHLVVWEVFCCCSCCCCCIYVVVVCRCSCRYVVVSRYLCIINQFLIGIELFFDNKSRHIKFDHILLKPRSFRFG